MTVSTLKSEKNILKLKNKIFSQTVETENLYTDRISPSTFLRHRISVTPFCEAFTFWQNCMLQLQMVPMKIPALNPMCNIQIPLHYLWVYV